MAGCSGIPRSMMPPGPFIQRGTGSRPRIRFIVSAATCLAIIAVLARPPAARPQTPHAASPPRIAGVSLVAPRRPVAPDRMHEVEELGAGWVAVVPYAFVRGESGEVAFGGGGRFWGERDEGVRAQVAAARAQGLRVLLKPQLWTRGEAWIGDYAPRNAAQWKAFEESYRAYLLGAARLAEELHVEMLCVGTEMTGIVSARPGFFRTLVADVRETYHGRLTYAANWDDYADVPFWSELDYVGVDAYFPLARKSDPTVDEIRAGWAPVVKKLGAFSRKVGRPILFTEYGYRSMAQAAGEQWRLPDVRRTDASRSDPEAQSRAYEALYRSVWEQPWFAGGFLWKWYLEPMQGPGREGVEATGYTPQGKPAERVVARWYGGAEAGAGRGRDPS